MSLSDAGNGSYNFTLYDNLDHPTGDGANTLPLNFGFTATDSDGDVTPGSFTVDVIDDVPQVTAGAEVGSVEERYLDGPHPTTFGNLEIDWNSDDRNVHLTFTSTTITDDFGNVLALTSGGVALKYAIVPADGSSNPLDQKLIAYKDGDTPDNPVFTVNLIAAGNPSYQFVLYQALDHFGTYDDTLPLTFGVTGHDGDGDTVTQTFTVTLEDWSPQSNDIDPVTIEEAAGSVSTGDVDLEIDFGADGDSAGASVTFVQASPTSVLTQDGAAVTLTSLGVGLIYVLSPDGTTLSAYRFNGTSFVGQNGALLGSNIAAAADAQVFTVTLSDAGTGSYNFTLLQPLDHPGATGTTQQLTLAFGFRIIDADGDDDFTNGFSVVVDAAGSVSTAYTAPDSAVFVNLSDTAQTVNGQTVLAHSVTDRATVADKVVGLDRLGAITMANGGNAGDILIGGVGNNKLFGNGGADILIGGGGLNTLQGGAGDDTTIYDVGIGGRDTVDGGADTDTQIINGTSADETFNINAINLGGISHLAANIDTTSTAADGSNYEVATAAVEEWVVEGGAGSDTFNITGPLLGTGIATSTLTIDGDGGADTLDLTNYAHDIRIVSDGGSDSDTVKFGFNKADATYAKVFAPDGVTLTGVQVTYNGVTHLLTNYETFRFADGDWTLPDLVNTPPEFTSVSSGQVTEDFTYTIPLSQRVTNGSFEGPTSAARLSGWTTSNIDLISEPHSGSSSVGVYQTTGTLTQTIQTVAGVTYTISFYASNPFDSLGEVESLKVLWDGQTAFSQGNIPASGSYTAFTLYSITVVATGPSTTLTIEMQDSRGWWVLDDVSVTAVVQTGIETASGTLSFSDVDIGDVHQVSYTPAAGGYYGTFTPVITDSATADRQGTITWTYTVNDSEIQHLAAGQTVTQTYTVSIDDGHGGVTTRNVDIQLHGTNDAPVATGDTVSMTYIGVPPGAASSTPVLDEAENNNSRPNANVIDRSLLKVAANANLTEATDPSITVKGSITDGSSDYFAITLKAGEKLVLDVDNTSGNLDTILRVRAANGDVLAYNDDSSKSLGGGGSNDSNGGRDSYLTYTATADGTYYIEIARYSGGTTGNYELQVSIDNMKWYTASPLTVSAATLLANDYDVDNGDTFTIVSVGGQGVTLVGGDVVVQPGVTSFTYTVRDSHGAESTATVQVDQIIVDPNDAPVLTGPGVALGAQVEDAGAPVGAVGTKVSDLVDLPGNGGHNNVADPDAGAVTGIALTGANAANGTWWYSLDNGATWSNVGNVSGTQALLLGENARLYFQPNADWNGSVANAITYRAWDQTSGAEGSKADTSVNGGTSAFSTAEVSSSLGVDAVNDAPQIHAPAGITVDEDGSFTFAGSNAITFSDVDGDVALTGSISITNGTLTFPSGGTANSITFGVTTISQLNSALANLVFKPIPNSEAPAQIHISITDNGNTGSGGSLIATKTITIDVNPIADAPIAVDDSVSATEDMPLVVSDPAQGVLANDSDPDTGDTISVVAGDYATSGGGIIHFNADGTYSYTPKADFNGIDTVEYTVTDASGATDTATLTIEVAAVNDAPQIHAPADITVDEDGSFTFGGSDAITFSDVDGNVALTGSISITNGTLTFPSGGTANSIVFGVTTISQLNAALANLVFKPTPNSEAPAQIHISITDNGNTGSGGSLIATKTITIDVNPIDDAPVTTPVALAAIAEDSGAHLITQAQLLANASDIDSSTLTATNLQIATGGGTLVNNNDGTWTYTPSANDDTAVSFSYTVSDGTTSVPGSATMDITPVNDLPQAVADNGATDPAFRMTEDAGSAIFDVLANDTRDVDDGAPNTVTISGIQVPNNTYGIDASDLQVTVTSDNKIQVTLLGTDWNKLSGGSFLTIPIGYTLHGDGADASSAFLTLRVTGVNDAPVLDATKTPTITLVEDAGPASFAGKVQVSSLASASGIGNVNDVDGTVAGIAITGASTAHGTWSWSMDGNTWFALNPAGLSDSHALLLYGNWYVYFQPAAGYDGTVSDGLTIRAWDQTAGTPGSYADVSVNGGSTAFSSVADTVSLTVYPGNDAPVITGIGTLAYEENMGPTVIAPSVTVVDSDSANFAGGSLTVALTANGASYDSLMLKEQGTGDGMIHINGSTVSYNPIGAETLVVVGTVSGGDNGAPLVVTFLSTATPEAIAALIESVAFVSASEDPSTLTRAVTYTMTDGDGGTTSVIGTITVAAVNDKPVFDLDTDNSAGMTGANYQTSYVGGAAAKSIADTDSHLTDVDNTSMASATITLTNAQTGDALNLDTSLLDSLGITTHVIDTSVPGKVSVTLGGSASLAAYESAIESVTFSSTGQSSVDRTVTVTVSDGTASSDVATTTIHVTPAPASTAAVAQGDIISLVPTGWTWLSDNGHIYKFVGTSTSWDAAVSSAASMIAGQSYLATVTSAGEDGLIDSLVGSGNRSYLGASDAATDGTWVWATGPEAGQVLYAGGLAVNGAYTDWSGTGPSGTSPGGFEEDYLATDLNHFWNDVSLSGSSNTIGYTAEAGGGGTTYAAITEDAPFSFSQSWLLSNDSNAPSAIMSVSSTSAKGAVVSYDAQTGLITYNASGSATLQHLAAGETTTDTFTYTIDDGNGGTSTATVTVNVQGVNDVPTGTSAALTVMEDVTRVLTLADFGYSDDDGDAMSGVTITSLSANAGLGQLLYGNAAVTVGQFVSSADIAAGMLNFAPKDNVFTNVGNVSFGFKVMDSNGASDASADTITIQFDNSNKPDSTSDNYDSTANASENIGLSASYKDSGGTDNLRIANASFATLTSLTFLRSDNNLEIGWASSTSNGYATVLDQYVGGNAFENVLFQANASYGGYVIAGPYTLAQGLNNSATSSYNIIAGTEASDTMSGGSSRDVMFGNGGHDTLYGNAGSDLLVGGLGDDRLEGGSSDDTYLFGLADGNDTVYDEGGAGDRIVIKTNGADLTGLHAHDTNSAAGSGNLMIQFNGQSIVVEAQYDGTGHAANTINFDNGTVYGYTLGAGDYTFDGSDPVADANGFRTVSVSSGSNFIAGEIEAANKIAGGSGADLIFGGDLADTLNGGGGNNLIVGGKGNDTLSAGIGNDVYAFGLQDGIDTITDSSGIADAIFIDTDGAALSGLSAYDNNNGTSSGSLVIQYNGQQVTVVDHFGGKAIERISFDGGSVDGYDLGTTIYTVRTNDPNSSGGARTVDLSFTSSDNFIAGEEGSANAITGGSARDLIFGGGHDDVLSGGEGNDYIVGGGGNDSLISGAGNDTLRGGSGADVFKFAETGSSNIDTILDYNSAEDDSLDLSALLDAAYGPGNNVDANFVRLVNSGADVKVQVDVDGATGGQNWADVAVLQGYHSAGNTVLAQFENTTHTLTVSA
ncbi:tandem-95 repeat protein [Rhodopseudomonas thermotolerans]|uniref:tandem-95 repeat protein n=1 Tax=Rhodopseudomonas thermotolerans TaxID=999700 RepID=UPI001AECE4B7|nr:tandem-95 repeat protein [Rhodopseudomonas thermotolerans]